ncbi:MAG: class III signal peptide-containing protein, partial [Candidatus Diapherotrites archaeon]|nr:class III signal peptide-containing protein [Candidatus Diapherotrites archaeon]
EKKAQTSLEYLLLIAGVIVVATIVGLYLKSIPPSVQPAIE